MKIKTIRAEDLADNVSGSPATMGYRRVVRALRKQHEATQWMFVGTCVSAKGSDISAMVEQEKAITYDTLRKHLGKALTDIEAELGYATNRCHGLYMKNDHHVGYYRSVYRGRPCLFFRWSAIEHIFQQGG